MSVIKLARMSSATLMGSYEVTGTTYNPDAGQVLNLTTLDPALQVGRAGGRAGGCLAPLPGATACAAAAAAAAAAVSARCGGLCRPAAHTAPPTPRRPHRAAHTAPPTPRRPPAGHRRGVRAVQRGQHRRQEQGVPRGGRAHRGGAQGADREAGRAGRRHHPEAAHAAPAGAARALSSPAPACCSCGCSCSCPACQRGALCSTWAAAPAAQRPSTTPPAPHPAHPHHTTPHHTTPHHTHTHTTPPPPCAGPRGAPRGGQRPLQRRAGAAGAAGVRPRPQVDVGHRQAPRRQGERAAGQGRGGVRAGALQQVRRQRGTGHGRLAGWRAGAGHLPSACGRLSGVGAAERRVVPRCSSLLNPALPAAAG
jgi:hypothetical protein